jgi:transcription initiation factor TFIIE subunit alpha
MKEEVIAQNVKLQSKEVQKICGKLKDDRLIKSEQKQEPRRDGKQVTKRYHYIDYKLFVDTVKWKIHQMTEEINKKRKSELQNKGYKCPECESKFSALEVLTLVDPETSLFMCEYCGSELKPENNEESENAGQELYSKLMNQLAPILDLLKETDNKVIPDYTPSASGNITVAEKSNFTNRRELRTAEDSEDIKGEIVIEFQNADLELLRKQQEEDSKLKRKQNELPPWYQFSTVTGERVAPGPEEDEPDKEEEEIEKNKDTILIDEDLDDSYLEDFYNLLKISSNDNIKLILSPISDFQNSDNLFNNDSFFEIKFEKEDDQESKKRRLDSMEDMGSDIEDETGQRKKIKTEQMNTSLSMNDEYGSSDINENEYEDQC